jgi:hypothetical protein
MSVSILRNKIYKYHLLELLCYIPLSTIGRQLTEETARLINRIAITLLKSSMTKKVDNTDTPM